VDHIGVLPNPALALTPNSTDFLALAPTAIFDGRMNHSRINYQVQAQHNSNMMGVIYEKLHESDATLTEEESNFLTDLLNFIPNMISQYFGFWWLLFKLAICALVVVGLLLVLRIRVVTFIFKCFFRFIFINCVLNLCKPILNCFNTQKQKNLIRTESEASPPPYGFVY
jgi:hypothetical protein